ncbi:MAG: HprK-related kinase B [Gammaproteobacteria bacterium]|nr:HprK-related kinase B [Gammaproteobacteria bacterium]
MKASAQHYVQRLVAGHELVERALYLDIDGWVLRLRSNSSALLDRLANYFEHVLGAPATPQVDMLAIECDSPALDVEFVEWRREAGKRGRKDSYVDLDDARLLRKVRTGMVFVQGSSPCVAAGECLLNDNQVINFVNAQYMNHLQQQGALICHAAGIVRDGRAIGIAGFSGGGKSTLMLHLLNEAGNRYLTNDRLFVRATGDGAEAIGVPKLPRVNPGTILYNRTLQDLIPDADRDRLRAMPTGELWELEQKYDVPVRHLFGSAPVVGAVPLAAFVILDWHRDPAAPATLHPVDLDAEPRLLEALMKARGPFYRDVGGRFSADTERPDPQDYRQLLAGTPVYVAHGGVDFAAVIEPINELLER